MWSDIHSGTAAIGENNLDHVTMVGIPTPLASEEAKEIVEKLDEDIRLQLEYNETRLPEEITRAKEQASFILQYDMNAVCEGNISSQKIGNEVIFL